MSTTADCLACFKVLPTDGKSLTCFECKNAYHLGQKCAGVAEGTFNAMGSGKRDKWRCRTCRASEGKPAAGDEERGSQDEPGNFAAQIARLSSKIDCLLSIKSSVDSLLTLPSKVDELLLLKPTVEHLKSTVRKVEESIEFFSKKYDSLLTTIKTSEAVVKELRAETSTLKSVVAGQSAAIKQLQVELNETEQYNRLSNLEIHGLPHVPNETLSTVVGELAVKVGLPAPQPGEILAIHRLPSRRDSIQPIIIRFASPSLKDKWMAARGRLRSLAPDGVQSKIFFNENLTKKNKELFWLARSRGREKHFRFVWVKRGKIFAKKQEGSPLIRIESESDLDSMN